jgi:hypothetical protein
VTSSDGYDRRQVRAVLAPSQFGALRIIGAVDEGGITSPLISAL